jgi:predicted dehydrogenase
MGIGQKHFEAINKYRGSKVISVLEKNKKKISLLKKKFKSVTFFTDEKKFFQQKDLNLISIASYDEDHYSQILKSIKNNCHIIVEKPLCLTQIQLKRIYYELKKKPNIKFISNLVLRYNSLFNKIKKKINLKNIYHIDAAYLWGRKQKLFMWRSETKNYSLTLGATIHILDLICWILNSRPLSVFAKTSNKITKNSKFKKFSFASYIFTFPQNILVCLKADGVCVHPHYHTITIFEKNKTFISNLNGQYEIKKKIDNFQITKKKYNYPDKKNRGKLIQNFIDCILDKTKQPISKKNIFDLMSACFYADLSEKKCNELKIKYLK